MRLLRAILASWLLAADAKRIEVAEELGEVYLEEGAEVAEDRVEVVEVAPDVEGSAEDYPREQVFRQVSEETLRTDSHKISGCGAPHSGTVVVGCEGATGLAVSKWGGNAVCQIRVVERVIGWRKQPPMTSDVVEGKMILEDANPQWMDALALQLQCLEKDDAPDYWLQIEVVEQKARNTTIGLVRFPLDEVISGRMAGRYPVMLRNKESDADFYSHVNDSRRFQFSFAEVDDEGEVVASELLETTTTTTLKLKWMKTVGELTVSLAFCPWGDGACMYEAAAAVQGPGETTPYNVGRFDCEQSCVEHLGGPLVAMIDEVVKKFEQVEKEGNYCRREEDHEGRCGKVGRVWVSCARGRCCSPAGWCGVSGTHCPGLDDYSHRHCKWNVQRSRSWQQASELLRTLPGRMVSEAQGKCGPLLVPTVKVIGEPAKDTMGIITHPEELHYLYARLETMRRSVQVMVEASQERWWTKGEMVPYKSAVTWNCWKPSWSK